MKSLVVAVSSTALALSLTVANHAVKAETYEVRPSLLNNGGYTINGPNGYSGTYTPSLLENGGGSYQDNNGGAYEYVP